MTALKREDELKLKALTDLSQRVGRCNLPEDDQLLMLYLEDRYDCFLEEGMRKLRGECDAKSLKGIGRLFHSSMKKYGRRIDSTDSSSALALGKLWTWVIDDVIVGGVPYAGMQEDRAGHLLELRRQCEARGISLVSVVSCLETDEAIPDGFAGPKDWERLLGVVTFFFVPFIPSCKHDNPPAIGDAGLEELLTICKNVYNMRRSSSHSSVFSTNSAAENQHTRCVVYIQCKTGQTRAWVFAMAYLISQLGMEYTDADNYLRQLRAFDPSPTQVELITRFVTYIKSPRCAMKPSEEDAYLRVLTDVLSLTPPYRERLLRDLENLT